MLQRLVARFDAHSRSLRTLPGVQEAFLDLFAEEEGGATRTIEISPEIFARLKALELGLHLTIGG